MEAQEEEVEGGLVQQELVVQVEVLQGRKVLVSFKYRLAIWSK